MVAAAKANAAELTDAETEAAEEAAEEMQAHL